MSALHANTYKLAVIASERHGSSALHPKTMTFLCWQTRFVVNPVPVQTSRMATSEGHNFMSRMVAVETCTSSAHTRERFFDAPSGWSVPNTDSESSSFGTSIVFFLFNDYSWLHGFQCGGSHSKTYYQQSNFFAKSSLHIRPFQCDKNSLLRVPGNILLVTRVQQELCLLVEYSFFVFLLVALRMLKDGASSRDGKILDPGQKLNCRAYQQRLQAFGGHHTFPESQKDHLR